MASMLMGLLPTLRPTRQASSAPGRRSAAGATSLGGRRLLGHELVLLDLALQLQQALEERLGARRAAGDVHVDRHDLVDAVDDVVAVVERPAAGGAGAHADDPLGLRHLVVEALEHRRHLLVDGAGHDHEVALARRGAEDLHAVAGDVVAREARREHLDGAAGEAVGEREDRVRARPAEDEVGGGGDDVGLAEVLELGVPDRLDALAHAHSRAPLRQAYRSPKASTAMNSSISMNPAVPSPRKTIAHGNRKADSTSKTRKRSPKTK